MHQLLRFWGSEATATRWTCGAWASSCTPCWSASRPSRPATSRPRACMMSSSAAILLSDSPVPQVQAHQCQLVHTDKMFIPDAAFVSFCSLSPASAQLSTKSQRTNIYVCPCAGGVCGTPLIEYVERVRLPSGGQAGCSSAIQGGQISVGLAEKSDVAAAFQELPPG